MVFSPLARRILKKKKTKDEKKNRLHRIISTPTMNILGIV